MDDRFVEQLVGVGALIEQQQSLEEGLGDLARLAAQSIGAARCSVMLLSAGDAKGKPRLKLCSHFGDLPAEAYSAPIEPGRSIAWHVVETKTPLLVTDVERSPLSGLAHQGADAGQSFMAAPILLSSEVIGVINLSQPRTGDRFEPYDLDLLKVFALFVGQSIHLFQLQRLSESRLLQMARLLEQREAGAGKPISPDPGKVAKIVAKSFFYELHRAGFGASAIIAVATEVLALLETSLQKHRNRAERHVNS